MYIFNPEHDLALGNFSGNYTPPSTIIKMRYDLAVLPVWYTEHEAVIAEGESNLKYIESVKELIGLSSCLISFNDAVLRSNEEIIPWGWNPAIRKVLLNKGVQESRVPTIEDLIILQNYSNRINAVKLLGELKSECNNFYGESHFFYEIDELLSYLNSTAGDKVLKMPLSGSGKGLIWILGEITDKQTDWCRRVIKNQGGVIAEPVLDKVVDFAMEFFLNKGIVEFTGYSLFKSAASGAYAGNELISDEKIMSELSKYISSELLHQLQISLTEKLSYMFPHYKGYAGVDMMICNSQKGYLVQPCVEINLRMNMGVVSRLFHNQFLSYGSEGKFIVVYFKKPWNTFEFNEKMQQESPLKVKNGKIVSGYLSLTPVTPDTHYNVYVIVK